MILCTFCQQGCDPANSYRRVEGWSRRAPSSSSRRGGEDIVLREHLDEWACFACVLKLRDGLSVEQGSLL